MVVRLKSVPVGADFEVWGKKFTVLRQDKGKVFVLATEFATTMPFREKGKEYKVAPNDFRDSSVKGYLNGEYIDELTDAGADRNKDIFPLTVDLKCTVGQHEYGEDTVQAGLLTLGQFGEFYKIIPPTEDGWWCLATPWKTPSLSGQSDGSTSIGWIVSSDGFPGNYNCGCPYGVRPALNLNPALLVSYGGDGGFDNGRGWDDYIKYLHKWAVDHVDYGTVNGPMNYDDWCTDKLKEEAGWAV